MQSEEEISEIVQRKVRHAVGRRGLQEIQQLIGRWREEEEADRKLWRATLIVVVAYSIFLRSEVKVVVVNDMLRQGALKP